MQFMDTKKIYSGTRHFFVLFCLFALWTAKLNAASNTTDDNKNGEKLKAMAAFDILDQSGNYTDRFTVASLNNLPMGLSRTIGNVEYCVVISGYIHKGDYAELTVYGKIVIPRDENQTLFFGAHGIKFVYSGLFFDEVTLMLLGDVTVPVHGEQASLILRGSFDSSTGTGSDLTYMTVNCDGFKELGITADVVFPETLIRKVDANGKPVEGVNGRVSGSFHTIVSDWEDILANITLPRFEIVGLDGFIFDIRQAVFDFSYLRNSPVTQFPEKYRNKYLIAGQHEAWQGIYIRTLGITLPEPFAKSDRMERVSFAAENMLLDNNGISGLFSAENILPLNQGNASGWRFSVEHFSLEIETNQLVGASFSGQTGLPVAEKADIRYEGYISHGNEYSLTVKPVNSLAFDLWAATAEIYSNSYITFEVVNNRFRPEAVLNGSLSINAGKNRNADKSIAVMKGIQFSNLHLTTEAPYISVERLGYSGSVKLGGFPLSVSNISFMAANGTARLGFNAKLSFISDKNPITAETGINIIGTTASPVWTYRTVEVSDIILDADIAEVFHLYGRLSIIEDDPVYGNGFAGKVDLSVDILKLDITTRAMFGNKEENSGSFRYWFVDGAVEFAPGILIPPAMRINGFGGGASSGMRPQSTVSGSSGLISLPSGTKATYIPDKNYGLGLKAAVMFNVVKDELIDGEASFELIFNRHGGLNFAGFYGQVQFLGKLPVAGKIEESLGKTFNNIARKEQEFLKNNKTIENLITQKQQNPNTAAQTVFEPAAVSELRGMYATAGIQYDFTNRSLHANFDLYVNIANRLLHGIGTGDKQDRAGWVVFHSDPEKWYLHAGTPTNRIGVALNMLGLAEIRTGSYFMVGHDIPASPPPPQNVANILGKDINALDYMRDLNALGSGTGVAFGSDFSVSTGDLTFLVFYANFGAGLGFDIMLKQYNAYCEGHPDKKAGIDGWYANGQAYAYLQGELGIKVKLWFIKKNIAIIKGAAAMLLQAKLPNPSWFFGIMGINYNVLGGLIKGNVKFELTLGDKCNFITDKTLEINEIISKMTPDDGSKEVNVFALPQVMFRMTVDKPFEISDINDNVSTYRIRLTDYAVSYADKSKTQKISGKIEWNTQKDALTFVPDEILPSTSKLKALVNVTFEEMKSGRWATVQNTGMEITFTTGNAPGYIPESNIQYTYPVIGQRYFHPGETGQAYVQLKIGQAYLFTEDRKTEIRISSGNKSETIPLTFDVANKCIKFTMPKLDLNTQYSLEILSREKEQHKIETAEKRTAKQYGSENEVSIRDYSENRQIIETETVSSLLKYDFRTSRFNTFRDKMNGVNKTAALTQGSYTVFSPSLRYGINGGEPFESVELTGTKYTGNKALVSAYATLTDNFYQSKIKPLLYEKYSVKVQYWILKKVIGFSRDVSVYGVPPVRAVVVIPEYLAETERGIFTNNAGTLFPYEYNLFKIYYCDFSDLRNEIADCIPLYNRKDYAYLLESSFPAVPAGNYETEFRYIFPNGNTGTSARFLYLWEPYRDLMNKLDINQIINVNKVNTSNTVHF
jgi:hypothetical protein